MDPFEALLQKLMQGGMASATAPAASPGPAPVAADASGAPGGVVMPLSPAPASAPAAPPRMPEPSFRERLIQLGRAGGLNLPDDHAENLTYQALVKKGVEPEIARAAVKNPEIMKHVLAAVYAPKSLKVGPNEAVITAQGQEIYRNRDKLVPIPQGTAVFDPQTGSVLFRNDPRPEKQVIEVFDEATGQPRKMLWDKHTGAMEPVGGVRTEKKAREFSVNDLGKLRSEGSTFNTVQRLGDTFRDEFSMPGGFVAGDVRNFIGRSLPAGATTAVARDAAAWWQDYKRNSELLERHELFGAALTGAEQAQWRQADINPNMESGAIRKNLETRRNILENGLRRYANALIQAGYDPAPIAAAFGLDLKALGVTTDRRRGATSIPDIAAPGGGDGDAGWTIIDGVRVRRK